MRSETAGSEAAKSGSASSSPTGAFSRIDMPLAAALLVGLSLVLALELPIVRAALNSITEGGLVERILTNAYCRVMLGVGAAGLAYGLLQALGLAQDRMLESPGRAGLLTGRLRPLVGSLAELPAGERRAVLEACRRREWQPLQFAIWLLPVLGFIGTVWGITGAIGGLSALMGEGRLDPSTAEQLLGGLRFAFDTTLLGLGLAIPLMALLHWLRARAEVVDAELMASRGCAGRVEEA